MEGATHWNDTLLDALRRRADPLADEVVAEIVAREGPGEARRLFDALIRRLEMPLGAFPSVIDDYLQATRQLPAWADREQVRQAQEYFLDHGPKLLFVLYFKSLPLLYCCAHGAAVLVRTSRLTHDDRSLRIFARRIAETGQFLIDVMTAGGLEAGGTGIQSIQKVRLIHAAIRHFVGREDWDTATRGQPINQEDMAVTLMTFSIALTDALDQFGIEEAPPRADAFFHTWRAIGHNLGLRAELLPADRAAGRRLLARILERQSAASPAGRLLTEALVDFARQLAPTERLRAAPEAFIRYLIGEQHARQLGLQAPAGCLGIALPKMLRTAFRLGERLEDRLDEPLQRVLDLASRQVTLHMVDVFNRYKGRNFHIPDGMRRAWFE